jgi:hypothetical protein
MGKVGEGGGAASGNSSEEERKEKTINTKNNFKVELQSTFCCYNKIPESG